MASEFLGGSRRVSVIVIAVLALLAGGAFLLLSHARMPAPVAMQAAPSVPKRVPPPPPWTAPQLRDLLDAIDRADGEGLRSADYDGAMIRKAVAAGGQGGASVDGAALAAARALAHDYAAGRIRNRHRFNWYIDHDGLDAAALDTGIAEARAKGRLKDWLLALLPTSADYRALRDALAATPDDDWRRRDRIKANMERWRWLPRDFGRGNQLYVNLPSYELDVVRDGATVATYRAVIGATDMPTPALSTPVRQIIVNPDWIVPQSIVRKSNLRPGVSSRYVFTRRPDGTLRVRQKPGAGNALGKVKIEFPNPLAIYFHDTPSRSLFGASVRTFSHGCVRVQHIDALARSISASPTRFDAAIAGAKTRGLQPDGAWRATIVYLTLVPGADGALEELSDPYKLDERMAAALEGRKPRSLVVAPPPEAAKVAPEPRPLGGEIREKQPAPAAVVPESPGLGNETSGPPAADPLPVPDAENAH